MKGNIGIFKEMASINAVKTQKYMLDPAIEGRKERTEDLVRELQAYLKSSQVLVPGSEGYFESIKRWSDAVEMRAVCSN